MYWSWWIAALALAGVALVHWFWIRRLLAVSGRFTLLVNRLRFGAPAEPEMNRDELIRAIRAATAELSGATKLADLAPTLPASGPFTRPAQPLVAHLVFLGALVTGGWLAALLGPGVELATSLRSEVFPTLFGEGVLPAAAVLLVGGALVGFGTRMAAGCTSGHGLCGVSRFQRGSILATAAFFGCGIVVSLGLGALL